MVNHPNRSKRPKWQPIETAPDEGIFLVFAPSDYEDEQMLMGERDESGEIRVHIDGQRILGATHWMPLPDPPSS